VSPRRSVALGAAFGLTLISKENALALAPVIGLWPLWLTWRQGSFSRWRPALGPLVRTALLVAVPTAVVPETALATAVTCPGQPLTVADLDRLFRAQPDTVGWAMGTPLGRACYGSRNIRIRAFANWPDGLGGTSPFSITPAWLDANLYAVVDHLGRTL